MTEQEVLQKLAVFKDAIVSLKDENDRISQDKAELDKTLEDTLKQLEASENAATESYKELDACRAEYSQLKESFEAVSADASSLKDKLKKSEESLDASEKTSNMLNETVSKLNEANDGLKADVKNLNAELKKLRMDKRASAKNLKELEAKQSDEKASFDKNVADLVEQLSDLQKELATARSDAASRDEQLKSFDGWTSPDDLKKIVEQHESAIQKKLEDAFKLRSMAFMDVQKYKDLKEQYDKQSAELTDRNKALKQKDKEIDELKKRIDELIKANSDAEAKNDDNGKLGEVQTFEFGVTTAQVISRLLTFIDQLYLNVKPSPDGIYYLNSPDKSRLAVSLNEEDYNTFMDRMLKIKCNNKQLFYWGNDEEQSLCSTFEKDWIKTFFSKIRKK